MEAQPELLWMRSSNTGTAAAANAAFKHMSLLEDPQEVLSAISTPRSIRESRSGLPSCDSPIRHSSSQVDATELRGDLCACCNSPVRRAVSNTSPAIKRCSSLETELLAPVGVLQQLLNGNARFILGETEYPHQDRMRRKAIAPQQKPMAAVLACADSRVPIELVFDQGFGDIFVCRIAGNIATAEEVASLEYAVLELGVKVIMVMGHSSCGAVKAALAGKALPGLIDSLVQHLEAAVKRTQSRSAAQLERDVLHNQEVHNEPDEDMLDKVIRENVYCQIERCGQSQILSEAVARGNLLLVPGLYDLNSGEVEVLVRPKPSVDGRALH